MTTHYYKDNPDLATDFATACLTLKVDPVSNYNNSFLIAKAIAETLHIVRHQQKDMITLFYQHTSDHLYQDLLLILDELVADAIVTLHLKNSFNTILNDVKKFLYANTKALQPFIETMNQPPRHILLFKNGVFDMKTGDELENNGHYHFTQARPLNFFKKVTNPVHKTILDRIFDDWSSGQKDVKLLYLQYLRAVVEGNNRGKGLIIYGEGGNGKSSFINFAERLVGLDNVVRLNIHQMENSFNLQGFNSTTALIAGDELKSSYRFGGESLSTCKMILDNQAFVLNLKGQAPKPVFPNTCLIQSTNTPLRFEESNDAVKDRFLYIEWSSRNFRQEGPSCDLIFDLKKLMQDGAFIESLLAYVYELTDYFEKFTIPKSVDKTTNERLLASDTVEKFLEYLEEEEFLQHNEYITATMFYHMYMIWLKDESPSAKIMARKQFFTRLEKKLSKRGWFYELANDRPKRIYPHTLTFAQLNFAQLEQLTRVSMSERNSSKGLFTRSFIFRKKENRLDLPAYEEFIETCKRSGQLDLNQLTAEEKRVLVSICFDKNDLEIRGLLDDWSILY